MQGINNNNEENAAVAKRMKKKKLLISSKINAGAANGMVYVLYILVVCTMYIIFI
jgi:hypothetical protein